LVSVENAIPDGAPPAGLNPGELYVVVNGAGPRYEVYVHGELDMSTAPRLSETLASLDSEPGAVVTVDLAGMTFVDSTGLTVLIDGLKRLRQGGGDLVLRSPASRTRRVLEITGLTQVFAIS